MVGVFEKLSLSFLVMSINGSIYKIGRQYVRKKIIKFVNNID